MDRCDSCGFVYPDLEPGEVPRALRRYPNRYAAVLDRAVDRGLARVRPRRDTWSGLEYACHVRDVLRVQRERLELALSQDQPVFTPMGRDERAIADRYNQQDPATVANELAEAAEALAAARWERTGVYNWPQQAVRNMVWLGQHTVHELIHHLDDIERGLGEISVP